jgi:Pyruvate/2-oxoacid:ferredoxin oxidoreductase delta subunit
MTTKTVRNIVHIDEEKCNGCGACVVKCAESALQIVDGKAKLVRDIYCDGLGACLGECPLGAITIEQRTAEGFDEKAVEQHIHERLHVGEEKLACGCPGSSVQQFSCPSAPAMNFAEPNNEPKEEEKSVKQASTLSHWPVQLALVPPHAHFLKGANVVLAADCVAFAHGNFHQDFLKDHALLIVCPKLDNAEAHLEKLTQVIAQSGLSSLTVVRMEVPCCSGLVRLAKTAIEHSGRHIPFAEVVIGVQGDVLT